MHSTMSGHAYPTIYEMAAEAKRKNMNTIAVTDHGPALIGSACHIHFNMVNRAPKEIDGVRLLWGVEANPVDENGTLDLDERTLKKLAVVIVGFHKISQYQDKGKEKNTEALSKALKNPLVKIISHPQDQQYEINFEKILKTAIENNVLLEINLSYLKKWTQRDNKEKLSMFKRIVEIVQEQNKKLIVNSDAHFLHEMGDDTILKEQWDFLGIREKDIINNYPEELYAHLGLKE
jgi:putative hydrolase